MQAHPLLAKLKALRLSGMLDTLDLRAEQAHSQPLSALEFLALLLDDELERRQNRALQRREQEAGFESARRLSQFDFRALPSLDQRQVREMVGGAFIERAENWLLHGPTGTGKSHLAVSTGYEALRRGHRVLYWPVHGLLCELYAARADGSYQRRLRQACSVELLILDDFGLRPVNAVGAEDLYEIIQRRYERASILLTSNRDPSEWAEVFGDALLASAALDRLTHHARITAITGESYRQRQRRERAQGPVSQEGGTRTNENDERNPTEQRTV